MALLLLVAGATYIVLGDRFDASVALGALAPVILVTYLLEARAERALDRLRQLAAPKAAVLRDGARDEIAARNLVPGDYVFLKEGDVVPADGELAGGAQLAVDESALTGESHPADKSLTGSPDERAIFAGTTVLSGRGAFVVTATGAKTRYGTIARLMAEVRQPRTPLQRVINRFVWRLGIAALLLCLMVGAIEWWRGQGWAAAVIAGVSLAMAAVPEEFPMVYTLYLALGAWRLARHNALVRRLTSVETLGATTVICTDKTGTLTLGRMELVATVTDAGIAPLSGTPTLEQRALVTAAMLASELEPFDPLEQAIAKAAHAAGILVADAHEQSLVKDYAFDPVSKYMTHVWRRDGGLQVFAKGAPEGILSVARAGADEAERMRSAAETLASRGMRVLMVATGQTDRLTRDRKADEAGLRLAGLIAFSDPLRPEVATAVRECREAGIRVIVMTGDHPATARTIAGELGIPARQVALGSELDELSDPELSTLLQKVSVFARTRPDQKFRFVKLLQDHGDVVAVTGDGTNDGPALRKADIGVAMGLRGTEVAREAAGLVLLDDDFSTIVTAIRDGRRIFENLRRAFSYLIAFHAPLLISAIAAPLFGAPLLLLPVHLVWLELIVHPTASLVFEADPPPPDLMRRPPRSPGRGLIDRTDLVRAMLRGMVLSAAVLALYLSALGRAGGTPAARSLALAAMIIGQCVLVLGERTPDRPFWRGPHHFNIVLPIVVGGALATLVLAIGVPAVARLLELAPLSWSQWMLAAGVGIAAVVWLEPFKTAFALIWSPVRQPSP